MGMEQLVVVLLIGGVAGWFAGLLIKLERFGLIGTVVVGIVGAVVGGGTFDLLGASSGGGWMGLIVAATVGAVVLLFVIGLMKKRE